MINHAHIIKSRNTKPEQEESRRQALTIEQLRAIGEGQNPADIQRKNIFDVVYQPQVNFMLNDDSENNPNQAGRTVEPKSPGGADESST